MAKVLLVVCQGMETLYDEQGPASIAAYLKKNNHEVEIKTVKVDNDFINDEDEFTPDVVGISVYHDDLLMAYRIAKYFKQKNIPIVVGGYSATYYYNEIFDECREIDFCMQGEGEESWRILCDNIDQKIEIKNTKNIVYRNVDGTVTANKLLSPIENLDEIDFTSKDIIKSSKIRVAHLSTTRGCFGRCSFCYSHKFFDPTGKIRWRGKSPELVVDEIKDLVNNYGINRIIFDDASFEDSTDGLKRMETIADLIISENLFITFEVFFRASIYRRLNDELLIKLKKAGLCSVFIGVESYNEKELKIFNKGVKVEDNENVVYYFRKHDIAVKIGFINLTPYSELVTLRDNARRLYQTNLLNTYLISNNLRAYKGTGLYTKIKEDGLLREDSRLNYYCYKYQCHSVEIFEKYLIGKLEKLNKDSKITIQSMDWYCYENYSSYITHYKSVLKRLDYEDCEDIIKDWEEKYWMQIDEHTKECYAWYSQLLDLLENGWSQEKADSIIDSYHILDITNKIFNKLNQLLFKVHYELRKKHKDISQYFVSSDVR